MHAENHISSRIAIVGFGRTFTELFSVLSSQSSRAPVFGHVGLFVCSGNFLIHKMLSKVLFEYRITGYSEYLRWPRRTWIVSFAIWYVACSV